MRVLVCGGRDFNDIKLLWATLNEINITVLIQGGARGADEHAKHYAQDTVIPFEEYPADWNKHGRKAGYIRNKQMLDEGKPDLVVAFPGGKGTAMMVKLAKEAGVKTIEIGSRH